ncbi:MAG TPA: BON domain-containing protein [Gemmatimonadota bacterium]|nr:BON domain-containing protein [Gemmatimonadota bacterium]
MKHAKTLVVLALAVTVAAGCGGDEEPAPEEASQGENVMSVPDSTIEREIRTRLDADPRLDGEGIDLQVASQGGTVMLRGQVPSRMEMSIAREVAMSAPGVVTVDLDSLVVVSEQQNAPAAADTSGVE